MVNFCLNEKEKCLLKRLIGKKLIKYKHDPLDKFDGAVYGRIELYFEDIIIMVEYDYKPYPLFGSKDDDHPCFSIKLISENEATSALQNIDQISISCNQKINEIILVEDCVSVQWNEMSDDVTSLKAIIFLLDNIEIGFQGDYMMPLIDILKGNNLVAALVEPGDEFENDPETKFVANRFCIELSQL